MLLLASTIETGYQRGGTWFESTAGHHIHRIQPFVPRWSSPGRSIQPYTPTWGAWDFNHEASSFLKFLESLSR